jgi:gamma-glutamylcyclotransferase (GGCT)/AIG2-like uncharacterized protein YtfP
MAQKLNLFVYGTLMKGRHNHHYLKDATFSCKATIGPGRLWSYGAFPALEYGNYVYYNGSLDYKFDMDMQNDIQRKRKEAKYQHLLEMGTYEPDGDGFPFGEVEGEFYELPYSKELLARLDSLEGFHGDDTGLYSRVLAIIDLADRYKGEYDCDAWVYIEKEPSTKSGLVPYCGYYWDKGDKRAV